MNEQTKEQLKSYAEAIAAFADGMRIQCFSEFQNCWLDWDSETIPEFGFDGDVWRVKIEPISSRLSLGQRQQKDSAKVLVWRMARLRHEREHSFI